MRHRRRPLMSAATPRAATYDVATFPQSSTKATQIQPRRRPDHRSRPASTVKKAAERLGVVVVGRRPVRPRLEDQHRQHAPARRSGRIDGWGRGLARCSSTHRYATTPGPGERRVLHDQQVDRVRVHPVQQRQRPHDQFEVGLVEGVAVVRVVPGVRGVVGVEVARGDLLPGLAVLAEVRRQVEVVPQVHSCGGSGG